MKTRIKFWLKILFTVIVSYVVIVGGYEFYKNYERDKEYELSITKVISQKLEDAKFIDLKLGSSISSYKGFKLLNPFSAGNYYDESIGEQAYGYFVRDGKYSHLGDFYLLDPISEAKEAGVKLSADQIARSSNIELSVFTFNKKIYKIEAVIKEYSDNNFNEVLKTAYGPSLYDNGHNTVHYSSDDEMSWESPNVLLTTYGETKPTYYKGRLSGIVDKRRFVTYLSKPLKSLVDSAQSAKSAAKMNDAVDKL